MCKIHIRIPFVAPFAGAWIEMNSYTQQMKSAASLPSRERGLKYVSVLYFSPELHVAPFAGAWIEIAWEMLRNDKQPRRSLRGSVD